MPAPRNLNYASAKPKARSVATNDEHAAIEFKIPLGLLIAGLLMSVVAGFVHVGRADMAVYMLAIGIVLVVVTIIRVIAAFIAVALIGTSFGAVPTATLKFAGIFTFTAAIDELLTFTGIGIISGVAALGLLVWLFEMEIYEAVIFSVISWVVGFGVTLTLAGLIASMLK